MNPNVPFTVHFSPYVTGTQATESILSFTIFDVTANTFVYDAGAQPASTTSLTIPAGTLAPSHTNIYELIFSNRDSVPSPGAQSNAQIGFDLRTTGTFTTAVPEPATLALLVFAAGMWGITRPSKRRDDIAGYRPRGYTGRAK